MSEAFHRPCARLGSAPMTPRRSVRLSSRSAARACTAALGAAALALLGPSSIAGAQAIARFN